MSRIFLNHNYRLFRIRPLPNVLDSRHRTESIIDALCYDDNNVHLKRLRKRIANTILVNEMYRPSDNSSGSLIPLNSRLYSNGRSTNDKLDMRDILNNLQLKVKMNQIEYIGTQLKVGHLRFQVLDIVPTQIFILIEMDPSNVLLMAKAAPKMQTVIADYLVNELDCLFEPLKLSDSFLRSMADSNVNSAEDMKDVGGIEMAFTGIRTKGGALNTMILNVGGEDLQKFKGKNGFTANLCDHISREVSIDLSKLELGRIRSELFSMGSDGRVRFSSLMSYRGNPEDFGDDRVSIWMVLRSLLSEASNSAGELSASKQ